MGNLTKGVLIIAMGHENYYRMAVNLAASIKRNSPNVDICVVVDSLKTENTHLFNQWVMSDLKPIECKTRIYDLSPFDKTLYLDVDMLILPDKDINDLFTELEGAPFSVMNECKGDDYSVWVEANVIRDLTHNQEDPLPCYYSELIYFERSAETKRYFNLVADTYNNCSIKGRSFGGVMADELAYIIASMAMKFYPHRLNWLPVFWHFRDKKDTPLQPYQLKDKYYGYSLGGHITPSYIKIQYNNLVAYYASIMKVTSPYRAADKRAFLSNREKI